MASPVIAATSPTRPRPRGLLGDVGYATYCVGKWHLVPPREMAPAGPVRPLAARSRVYYYYGFLHGMTDQWTPNLWEDNHSVAQPEGAGYHLSADLVDRSLEYLRDYLSAILDRPFFMYLCSVRDTIPTRSLVPTSNATPVALTTAGTRRVIGSWLGRLQPASYRVIPVCLPNPDVAPWDSLGGDERRLLRDGGGLCRISHTCRRSVGALGRFPRSAQSHLLHNADRPFRQRGELRKEVDSVTSAHRTALVAFPRWPTTSARSIFSGNQLTANHYPSGWAQAGNTPLRYYKMHTHGGAQPRSSIIHWPARGSPIGQ